MLSEQDQGGTVVDKAAIRAEWVAMREDFQQLIADIPPEAWRRKSKATRWTIAELCAHIAHDVEAVPMFVDHARRGKNFLKLPSPIIHPIGWVLTKIIGRKATPASLVKNFTTDCEHVLKLLDEIEDDEWHKGAYFFDAGYWTIEYIFYQSPQHFAEHAAQIRESL